MFDNSEDAEKTARLSNGLGIPISAPLDYPERRRNPLIGRHQLNRLIDPELLSHLRNLKVAGIGGDLPRSRGRHPVTPLRRHQFYAGGCASIDRGTAHTGRDEQQHRHRRQF